MPQYYTNNGQDFRITPLDGAPPLEERELRMCTNQCRDNGRWHMIPPIQLQPITAGEPISMQEELLAMRHYSYQVEVVPRWAMNERIDAELRDMLAQDLAEAIDRNNISALGNQRAESSSGRAIMSAQARMERARLDYISTFRASYSSWMSTYLQEFIDDRPHRESNEIPPIKGKSADLMIIDDMFGWNDPEQLELFDRAPYDADADNIFEGQLLAQRRAERLASAKSPWAFG